MHVWTTIRHPNIIDLAGIHLDLNATEAWIITQWEPLGDIRRFIKSHRLTILDLLRLVCEGALYLRLCPDPSARSFVIPLKAWLICTRANRQFVMVISSL